MPGSSSHLSSRKLQSLTFHLILQQLTMCQLSNSYQCSPLGYRIMTPTYCTSTLMTQRFGTGASLASRTLGCPMSSSKILRLFYAPIWFRPGHICRLLSANNFSKRSPSLNSRSVQMSRNSRSEGPRSAERASVFRFTSPRRACKRILWV